MTSGSASAHDAAAGRLPQGQLLSVSLQSEFPDSSPLDFVVLELEFAISDAPPFDACPGRESDIQASHRVAMASFQEQLGVSTSLRAAVFGSVPVASLSSQRSFIADMLQGVNGTPSKLTPVHRSASWFEGVFDAPTLKWPRPPLLREKTASLRWAEFLCPWFGSHLQQRMSAEGYICWTLLNQASATGGMVAEVHIDETSVRDAYHV